MEQSLFFGNAAWIGKKERTPKTFTVIRGHFDVSKAEKNAQYSRTWIFLSAI